VSEQDLAPRLRELKDRSGQSFGTLAKQLHVGTSTLHRYCSGEAVPAEYGTVEKFGRLCGATPDELLDLHRAWLLADARRSRTPEPTPDVSAETSPPPPPAALAPPAPPGRKRRVLLVGFLAVSAIAGAVAVWSAKGDESPAAAAPPLNATVRTHLWEAGCDHSYLVDRPPAQVPEPPVEADAPAWAAEQKAVDANRTIVEVTLTGTAAEPTVLQGVTVRVDRRGKPLPWNVYAMSLGCGGALTPASYAVDLDQPRPVARATAGHDGEQPLPAVTFPFRVSSTEPVVLRVIARTKTCDCDWHLDLPWTSGGRSGTLRVDDTGRSFRTSGGTGKAYGYTDRWAR
jgi:hypothetical protein